MIISETVQDKDIGSVYGL